MLFRSAIGGQITTASKAPQRDQMAGITRWFQLELARLNVDLRLGTAAGEYRRRACLRPRHRGCRCQWRGDGAA